MLNNNTFYHAIIRKSIVAFGSIFSNIKIERKDEDSSTGPTIQTLAVPVAYAPKEKWVVRLDQDPDLNNHVYTILPLISFEMTGMSYDTTRKLNRMNQVSCYQDGSMTSTRAPIPYNIDISMYVMSKTQEDCLQIIEQILPYFNPEYNLSVKVIPETNTILDVPVVLNSVAIQDDYEGDFQTRRFVTYTLQFTMKVNLFGPVSGQGVIETAIVNTDLQTRFTANGDPVTGVITEEWLEGF